MPWKKNSCTNCGKSLEENKMELNYSGMKINICSDQCEQEILKTLKNKRRTMVFTFGSLALSLVVGFALIFLGKPVLGTRLLFIGMGLGIIFFPLPTPQTVSMFGLRKAKLIVRMIGVSEIFIGIALSIIMKITS